MAFGFATAAKVGSPGTPTNSLTSAGVTSSGNFLVIVLNLFDGLTPNTPTDSKSNTWTALTGSPFVANGGGGNTNIYAWYAQNATVGASHTFTISLAAAATSTYSFAVIGMTGRASSSAIDLQATPGGDAANTTSHVGPSITPLVTGDDIIVAFGDSNGATLGNNDTWTAGASLTLPAGGFTSDARFQSTSGVMYQAGVGTSAISTAFTSSSSTRAGFFVIAVKAAAAATSKLLSQLQNQGGF